MRICTHALLCFWICEVWHGRKGEVVDLVAKQNQERLVTVQNRLEQDETANITGPTFAAK